MKNRLLKYRDDLTYPEWISEYKSQVTELFKSYCEEHEIDESEEGRFLGFSIGLYLETCHASNRVSQFPPLEDPYWE